MKPLIPGSLSCWITHPGTVPVSGFELTQYARQGIAFIQEPAQESLFKSKTRPNCVTAFTIDGFSIIITTNLKGYPNPHQDSFQISIPVHRSVITALKACMAASQDGQNRKHKYLAKCSEIIAVNILFNKAEADGRPFIVTDTTLIVTVRNDKGKQMDIRAPCGKLGERPINDWGWGCFQFLQALKFEGKHIIEVLEENNE